MALNYGTVPSPTQFAIGLITGFGFGFPVLPLRDPNAMLTDPATGAETSFPAFVVNTITGGDDKYVMNPILSLHTFARGNTPAESVAIADDLAFQVHLKIISMAPGDPVTLPNGTTVTQQGWPETNQIPIFQPWHGDPYVARYYAKYLLPLRFTAQQ